MHFVKSSGPSFYANLSLKTFLICACYCVFQLGHTEKNKNPSKKATPSKTTVKKPILSHEKLVELLTNDLPTQMGLETALNQNILNFTSSFIGNYSAVASSITWSLFIEKQNALYPIKDTSLPKFVEIMLQSNFKAKTLAANQKLSAGNFEALYFAYRFYLASLNSELNILAKGKAFVPIDDARNAFIKARSIAVEVFNKHIENQETLKALSKTNLYLLGDFIVPANPTQVPTKDIGILHSESIVKLEMPQNYAFEIYNYAPKKKRTMRFKSFQFAGLENAAALLYKNNNKLYLVLAKDILSTSKETPALELTDGKISYLRKIAKSSLGSLTPITPEIALLFKNDRLKLLPFYRFDVDAKRKSRIEAAEESAANNSFVESILLDLNDGKTLEKIIAEKTNGLDRARRRLYTVFNADDTINESLTTLTRRGYEKALQDASIRTGIPSVVIETSLYLESTFDPLSENTKEKREQKGNFDLSGDVWGKGLAQLSPAESFMSLERFYNFENDEVKQLNSQPIAYGDYINQIQINDKEKEAINLLIKQNILLESDFVVPEYVQEVEKLLEANKWKQLSPEKLKELNQNEEIKKRSIAQIQNWIRLAEKSPKSVWSPYYAIQRFADHLFAIQRQDYYFAGNRKAGPYFFGDKYSMRNADQLRFLLAIYNRGQGYLTNSIEFQRVYNGGVLIPGNYYYTWAAGRGKTPEEKLSMLQLQWEKDKYFILPRTLELREKPMRLRPTLETQFINLRHIIYGIGIGNTPQKGSVFEILQKLSASEQMTER